SGGCSDLGGGCKTYGGGDGFKGPDGQLSTADTYGSFDDMCSGGIMEFPLSEEVSTASEESSHDQKKRDATAEKIALLLKSSRYSVVPPPAAQIYSPPKKDMSWIGLPEFKDDTVTDYSRPSRMKKGRTCPTNSHKTISPRTGSSQKNIDDKGYWDSGCSRHMTGNISYLSDYEPFDEGYVSFGQEGCKNTGKGTIKTDVSSLRYIALSNWVHDALLESSSTDQLEKVTVETPIPTVSSPVPTACLNDSSEPSSNTRLISKRVSNQVETPSLDNILTLTNRFEDILGVTTNSVDSYEVEADVSNMEITITASPAPTLRIHKDHPKSQIIGLVDTLIQTRNKSKEAEKQKPKKIYDALQDPSWVLKNKKDERRIVIINKVRLVAQGHTQEKRIDYDEVFAPVARIEAIRLLLAYALFIGFTVYQMDVKSIFLYGTIDEEVYVMQPPGFQNPEFPARVYKVEKAMYGLHQAPRAWYGTLFKYLLTNGFQRGTIDQTLFIKRQRGNFIIVQVYVDDIIFGSSNPQLYIEFKALMHEKFQMSAMGELNFFLGLQVQQKEDGIFLSQDKYVGDILKKFGYSDVRSSNTPMDKENPWGKDVCFNFKPTVYVSHIRQFWSTARIETTKEGTKILATIDGNLITVSESSTRRNLKLNDEAGISSLPDAELFENLTLMGYNISSNQKFTFQKGQFSHQWKYLIHTIMQCMSPKSTGFNEFSSNIATALVCLATNKGEGSGTPTEPHHTPSLEAQQTSPTTHSSPSLPPVTTASIPTVTLSLTPYLRQYTKRARIAQSSALPHVADEPASPLDMTVKVRLALLTLDLKQIRTGQTKLRHLPCPMSQHQGLLPLLLMRAELEITSLKARIKLLEDKDRGVAKHSGDDASIKGRRLDVGKEAAERVSDDTEEMATVLTSVDAATVLASGLVEVPTSSGSIPTTVPPATGVPTGSDVVPTAGLIFATATESTPYTRRKGKETMIDSETTKKKKVQEQLDIQMARHLEEEMEREA
nr:hypothetical protein [Tanacetum cinerariifolium]